MPKKKKHVTSGPTHGRWYLAISITILFALVLFLLAYKTASAPTRQAYQAPAAVYSGTTPCADCSGIKTTLTLSQNPKAYSMNLNYEGKNTSFTEKGTWTQSEWKTNPPKTVYTLVSETGNKTYYQALNATQIRQLDGDGNPIPDSLPFTLTKE